MNILFRTVTASKKPSNNNVSYFPTAKYKDTQCSICMRDLEIMMMIGIHSQEKTAPQRIIINLEISLNANNNYHDSIENTVSYDDILVGINSLSSAKHYNLIETFADEVANFCLSFPLAKAVKLNVEKPDILKKSKAVGFTLCRKKMTA